jgi:hypothetical protein
MEQQFRSLVFYPGSDGLRRIYRRTSTNTDYCVDTAIFQHKIRSLIELSDRSMFSNLRECASMMLYIS